MKHKTTLHGKMEQLIQRSDGMASETVEINDW